MCCEKCTQLDSITGKGMEKYKSLVKEGTNLYNKNKKCLTLSQVIDGKWITSEVSLGYWIYSHLICPKLKEHHIERYTADREFFLPQLTKVMWGICRQTSELKRVECCKFCSYFS